MSRIENANAHLRPAEVAAVLKIYGVHDPGIVAALESLAKDAIKKGWRQSYSGLVAPACADYLWSPHTDGFRGSPRCGPRPTAGGGPRPRDDRWYCDDPHH
ncbi:hypothetical protein [Sphaerisporangium album]|uniref:hypothetical protein n=1 Tax=Sphaerisporangium album TaxID=509200 RepID=UPI0011C041D5|nr:hypothetical protein [Sphaerisporangium album]